MALSRRERERFDALVAEQVAALPQVVRDYMDEVPLVVEDVASAELLAEVGIDDPLELQGLHLGPDLPSRSLSHGIEWPEQVMLFREALLEISRGRDGRVRLPRLIREIRVTILHEYGHHVGLTEDDLDALGYG